MSQEQERFEGKQKPHGRRKGAHPNHKQGRQQKQPRPLPRVSFDGMLQRFMACVNCGYFMTAYRAHHGAEVLHEVLEISNERRDGWLHLPWDLQTSRLIHRFYGVRSDVGPNHLEFMCQGCQRKFIYAVIDEEEKEKGEDEEQEGEADNQVDVDTKEQVSFQVELKLR